MRVVLMRHGKPSLHLQQSISSLRFKDWIDAYDSSEICESHKPTVEAMKIAKSCDAVVCSSLKRSIRSANLLTPADIYLVEHMLREMEMPSGTLTGFKLRPNYWAVIFRVLWFFGYARNSESFKDAKVRAERAALLLTEIAREKDNVLFIGHGMLNRFIAKSLIKSGWKVAKHAESCYWGFGIYEQEE